MTICLCCLVPVIIKIRFVLFGLSFSLLDSIKNKISVRQSLKVGSDSRAFHYGNMGIGGGGGQGGTCTPGSGFFLNLDILWRVDYLLFVLSRSSSIFVN